MAQRGIIINNELTDPLGEYMIDYLLSQTKETKYLDFKSILDISKNSNDFPKIIKDVYAFSNAGGGFLVLGVRQNDHTNKDITGLFAKLGLPSEFSIEQAILQEKINSYFDTPIEIGYTETFKEFYGSVRKFAIIYIPPSTKILVPPIDGMYKEEGKRKKAFYKDVVYTRRGTQCVPAHDYELAQIKKRIKNEKYQLSIINGEPDEVKEILYSNLFEVIQLPKKIYSALLRDQTTSKTLALKMNTQLANVVYAHYKDQIISFQNLNDTHYNLTNKFDVHAELLANWTNNIDKEKIIIALLNKEVRAYTRRIGMRCTNKTIYYPATNGYRNELWQTRYKGVQPKQVAKLMWSDQLNRKVSLHGAVKMAITKIHEKFYLRLNPTMIITSDGKVALNDPRVNTIITSNSYNRYNKSFLNNILFWINKLGDGKNISVLPNFVISNDPIQTAIETGIEWDIPTSDLKKFLEEYDAQTYGDELEDM